MFQGINVWTELTMSSVVLARMDEGPWWEHECQNITELKKCQGSSTLIRACMVSNAMKTNVNFLLHFKMVLKILCNWAWCQYIFEFRDYQIGVNFQRVSLFSFNQCLIKFDLVTPDSGFKNRVREILVGFSGISGSQNCTKNYPFLKIFF